ncbi:YCF48-related protein [Massilia sp. BJB1822]|uniref:YCF48-related protein n=1 Tax=Massilia sp. BJB1822 TaxID=2744470 RepID=UPI0015936E86|nr:YCF48-related protein [Massilia sp. BJB1822]NVD99568.1 PKD domain-containing protein [Massilia sp. BJB1822]
MWVGISGVSSAITPTTPQHRRNRQLPAKIFRNISRYNISKIITLPHMTFNTDEEEHMIGHIPPRSWHKVSNWILLIFAGAAITACGGSGSSGSTPPAPSATPPTVKIAAAEQNEAATPVKFSPSISNPSGLPLQYAWNFGDGQTSANEQPEHRYAATGNYLVTVTITSSAGTSTSSLPIQVGYFSGLAGLDCTGAKNAQGWCRQSHRPTSQDLKSLKMASKNVAWTLGTKNTIFRSTDGGNSWFSKRINTTATLKAITAVDANTAWVVGTGGFEAHTQDGGATWRSGRMPDGASADLWAIAVARDANTLWATGEQGAIFKSTDGGATWSNQSMEQENYICRLSSVSVVDAATAWAAGPTCIARTSNGGQQWIKSDGFNIRSISAVDANTAWVSKSSAIEKTSDGGKTWTEQLNKTLSGTGVGAQYTSVSAVDANTIFAADFSGFIVKTSDGGKTWQDQSPPQALTCCGQPHFSTIAAFDANNAIAVGLSGVVYASKDGVHWISQNKGLSATVSGDIRSIAVFDANHAALFTLGDSLAYYTENGGLTWSPHESPRSLDCARDIAKVNATSLLGLGCNSSLLRSTDQGKTWNFTYLGAQMLTAIAPVGENTVWAAGEGGTVALSKNGGSWTVLTSRQANVTFNAIAAIDENIAWAAGDHNTIIHTTDAGKTWTTQTSGSTFDGYTSIIALNANTAWATHSSESVMATVDGGATWVKLETGVPDVMRTIATLDGRVLWAAGMRGKIIRSEDGGKTWLAQESGVTENLTDIRLIDNNTAWVSGELGAILKTATGGK